MAMYPLTYPIVAHAPSQNNAFSHAVARMPSVPDVGARWATVAFMGEIISRSRWSGISDPVSAHEGTESKKPISRSQERPTGGNELWAQGGWFGAMRGLWTSLACNLAPALGRAGARCERLRGSAA